MAVGISELTSLEIVDVKGSRARMYGGLMNVKHHRSGYAFC